MTNREIAEYIARGLIETGVEGGFDNVCCSTAGDYPSVGVSSWEGTRADNLLSYIDGGDYYANRSYSDLEESDELEDLAELLDSPQGQEAQLIFLANDAEYSYVSTLMDIDGFENPWCIIYAGIWCPTSHYVVSKFIRNRRDSGYDINNLDVLADLFEEEYAYAADCDEYAEGYANRAVITYEYVIDLRAEYEAEDYIEHVTGDYANDTEEYDDEEE